MQPSFADMLLGLLLDLASLVAGSFLAAIANLLLSWLGTFLTGFLGLGAGS